MKHLLLFLACTISFGAFAQQKNAPTAKANLKHVTVYYLAGAELTHDAKLPLGEGMQEVVLTNVATQMDVNTLQIACPANVVLLSYRHQNVAATEPAKNEILYKRQQDSLLQMHAVAGRFQNDHAVTEDVLNRMTKLIENNFGNKKEVESGDLIQVVQYYVNKVQELKHSLYALQLKRDSVYKHINELQQRINLQSTAGNVMVGQVVLQVMAQQAGSADFSLSYFTRNAGWAPAYDVRVASIDNSMKLVYKASVTQSTGLHWKDVKLSLSTSHPNQAAVIPEINPMYLQLYVPALLQEYSSRGATIETMSEQKLDEVVTTGYNKQRKRTLAEATSNVSNYTSLSENQLNINFDINLPYDIPSDNKAYSVAIKEETLKPTFKHFAVPKVDNDAFLLAELTNWQSLDLMPAQANIIMDNVYIGKSSLDPAALLDTLNLSLGRDKRISLKRELVKDLTSVKTRGDTKTETYTYEITTRNNKKQPVNIMLKDQYPVSTMKDVQVTLEENSGAEVNSESGILTWNVAIAPGETKKLRFTYNIKYPKDKRLHPTK